MCRGEFISGGGGCKVLEFSWVRLGERARLGTSEPGRTTGESAGTQARGCTSGRVHGWSKCGRAHGCGRGEWASARCMTRASAHGRVAICDEEARHICDERCDDHGRVLELYSTWSDEQYGVADLRRWGEADLKERPNDVMKGCVGSRLGTPPTPHDDYIHALEERSNSFDNSTTHSNFALGEE